MTKISIIIPIYNEVDGIHRLLLHLENVLSKKVDYEIIIVDGGSSDGSQKFIPNHRALTFIQSEKGRAKQMNAGTRQATGDLLYFLHCDSYPPANFDLLIKEQVKKGNQAGCFRMKFDYAHPVLFISQWFTRINHIACRGGDQSLFVTKKLFDEIGGFNEDFIIYEDNEIISRLYAKKHFKVIPRSLITSARRYRENGVWKLQYHFAVMHFKRRRGYSAKHLLTYYQKNIT
tara:strand:- start:517 stop:1209 length:693 start_codon:yes stop_codon:yes gene_type:complete